MADARLPHLCTYKYQRTTTEFLTPFRNSQSEKKHFFATKCCGNSSRFLAKVLCKRRSSRRSDQTKRFDKIIQQQVTVSKSMRVNTTVACDWLNFEFQSLRLILVAAGDMPPRRTTNRQTEQGITSTDILNAAARINGCIERRHEYEPDLLKSSTLIRSDQTKRFDKIIQQQVTVAKSMRVNTTVACDWLNFEFQSLRLILVAAGGAATSFG
ncbi:pentatricopeptide repeat-containing protein mitochondrial-like [Dorcoceras hygrometricum]|uniref:Pentatricopeptide repeat-containing protein mitochondrial-like n=1 Tax=Dorcoceras hygrometricum TaxID=472368 RepID=A0A2Z7CPW4_9LAMI|nr:pentatricopeptide repeat-containing protein mitochondrial-like [Dorcoceras hygrometricum]